MISVKTFNKYAADPMAFFESLTIDVSGVAKRFGDVMDPWQRADFQALAPGLMKCNGRLVETSDNAPAPKMRFWSERPRGSSKTSDIAVACIYAMAFATRPIRAYSFACDRDQAGLLKDAMATIVRLNPWLADVLDVQRTMVENHAKGHPGNGAKLEIFSSDVASSWGLLPSLVCADEITAWTGDGSLWHSILSSAAKRNDCMLFTIGNAGFTDSWQWNVREVARTDEAWHFSRLESPPSWMTPARLAEQKRMLPSIAYLRLWENVWSSGGGDCLSPQDVAAAFYEELQPMKGKEPGWLYVAGVDLGLVRDGSCVIVLAVPADGRGGRLRLADHKLWRPTLGQKINLTEVEQHILDMDALFGLEYVAFDPWQAEHMAQRLEIMAVRRRRLTEIYRPMRRRGAAPWLREIPPVATNLRAQATLTIECFQDRRLMLFPCEPLRRDLLKLRVVEKSYGIRVESPRDGEGHGDSFSALALALLIGHELAGKKPVIAGAVGSEVDGPTVSPLQRAAEELDARSAAYNAEMQALHKASKALGNQEGFMEVMRKNYSGRLG